MVAGPGCCGRTAKVQSCRELRNKIGHAAISNASQIFGSAPLLAEAGNTLASAGVALYSIYGSTEGGLMSIFMPGTYLL